MSKTFDADPHTHTEFLFWQAVVTISSFLSQNVPAFVDPRSQSLYKAGAIRIAKVKLVADPLHLSGCASWPVAVVRFCGE